MFPHPTVTVPSFSMRASVVSGWFCIPARLVSYVQPTRVFASSKHAERLAGGKSKIGKGTDLEPCIICHAAEKILGQRTWRHAFVSDGIFEGQQGMAHDLAEVLCFQSCIKVGRVLPSAEEASCIFPSHMKLEIFGYLAWETKGERKKQTLEEASGPASASARKHKRRVIKALG